MHEDATFYRHTLRSLAAVILLGTPHSTMKDRWKAYSSILQTGRGNVKRRAPTFNELEALSNSSGRFEVTSIDVPVVSVFETRPTKIRRAMGFIQRSILVDKRSVITNATHEEIIPLDADHRSLCNIDAGEEGFRRLCERLLPGLDDARTRIATGSPEYHPPTILDSSSDEEDGHLILLPSELQGLQPRSRKGTLSFGRDSRTDPRSMVVALGAHNAEAELQYARAEPITLTTSQVEFPILMVPLTRNKAFFAREEDLMRIERAFFDASPFGSESTASAGDTPRAFAICGSGGIGKTQLAAEFVFRYQDRFDAIFWITAEKAAKIADSLKQIAIRLGLISEDSVDVNDPVITRELVKGWLANPVKDSNHLEDKRPDLASWLLIFDNVDQPDELEDNWPLDGSGCVLFTGRDPFIKNAPNLARRGLELQPFSISEASRYLAKMTKKEGDSSKVAEMLGGFPLAMTQIAGYIIRRGLTFNEFIIEYEEGESQRELFEQKVHLRNKQDPQTHNLATVWALDSLREGAVLLKVLSFLDPDGIVEKVLKDHPHNVPLDDYPRSSRTYNKARGELLQSSLIQKGPNETIVIHRLIQDAARIKMGDEEFRRAFTTATSLVSSVWPYKAFGWRHDIENWKACAELFPSVWRLKDFSRQLQPPIGELQADLTFIKLMTDAGWFYHESGNSFEATDLFKSAQEAAERSKAASEESPKAFIYDLNSILAEIHHNLGCVGTETNDPEATLEHFQAFKNIVTSGELNEVDSTSLKVSIAWNELGNAWMLNNDWTEGEKCFKESIAAVKAAPVFDHTDMSFPTVNLGLAYWFTDRLQEAASVLEEGLQHREAKFGKDDKQSFITGRFLHALGNVKKSQGQLDQSFELHKRGLSQYLSTLGKNHHRTGDLYIKAAEHYASRGQLDAARGHVDEAIRIFHNRPSLRHEYCRALVKQSLVLDQVDGQEAAAAAKTAMGEAVKIHRELFPNAASKQAASGVLTEDEADSLVAFWSK